MKHANETLDLRSFYLRLIRKIWILPVAALLGAAFGLLLYFLATVVFGPGRQYSSESYFYIKFAYDEQAGTLVDHYNAYTWNTLISTDPVIIPLEENLKSSGVTMERGDILAAVTAEIPSDVRVLKITVKTSDKDLTTAITEAAAVAIEKYGDTNDAFDSIDTLSKGEASPVVYTDRTVVAAISGAVLFVIAAILILLLMDALDDAIYVPEDIEKRFGLPVIGTTFKDKGREDKDLTGFFANEAASSYEKIVKGAGEVVFISADSIKDDKLSVSDLDQYKKALGTRLEDTTKFVPMAVPGTVLDNYRKIGTADGVILAIPAGMRGSVLADHTIGQLKKHECPILGVLLTRADKGFIKSYYRFK
ncbi:MAG: hypothetical protein K6G10_03570 [Butyrivibrio sp.]|nr:hypothetical protein [Butyrivibrio sp.]